MPAKVISSSFVISSPSLELCPRSDKWEFVFIGRSNVGKSSLINALCDKQQLAKTSGQPGKTQLINYFAVETAAEDEVIQSRHLVDLPGYGYAKVTRDERAKWEVMIDDYILKRTNIAQIYVLIDSRLTPQKLDTDFVSRLYENQKPFSLVFTKSDKISQKDLSAHVKMFMDDISVNLEKLPNYYITSAEKKHSTNKLAQSIHDLNLVINT